VFFAKGVKLNSYIFPDDIALKIDMDQTQFRQEVSKLGKITKANVNPPEVGQPTTTPKSKKSGRTAKKKKVGATKKQTRAKKKSSKAENKKNRKIQKKQRHSAKRARK